MTTTGPTFKAVWPIRDAQRAAVTLITEARAELPALTMRHRVTLTGPIRWYFEDGTNEPGAATHGLVLVAEAPARKLPRRDYSQHPTTWPKEPTP